MKFWRLLIPALIACLALTSCSSSEGVLRGVKMGMTSSEVFSAEAKRDDSSAAIPVDNQLVYHDVTVFEIPCYLTYFFSADGELNKISCVFDEPTGENYTRLIDALTDQYGEKEELPDFYGNYCKWRTKDLVVGLTFVNVNENVSGSLALTYLVPAETNAAQ